MNAHVYLYEPTSKFLKGGSVGEYHMALLRGMRGVWTIPIRHQCCVHVRHSSVLIQYMRICRDITPRLESQMEDEIEKELKAGLIIVVYTPHSPVVTW